MDSLYNPNCHPSRETQLPEGLTIERSKGNQIANKMFIGGITSEISKQALIRYLSKFGRVTNVIIKTYPVSDASRGYGFVLFKKSSTIEKVLQVKKHIVCGKKIHLQRAKVMESNYSNRKVFVGGLNPQVPEGRIIQYFGKFGQIEKLELPTWKNTKERRTFCFITYTDESSVEKVLEHRFHYIGVEPCEVKPKGRYRNPNRQQRAESNAPFLGVGNSYGNGEYTWYPNAFFANQNDYGAVAGGQGLPVAFIPVPLVAYHPQFAFPAGAYDHFYNGYTNQPVFNSYSGQYFLGYDYYNYATGAVCNEQTNQAVAFHTD